MYSIKEKIQDLQKKGLDIDEINKKTGYSKEIIKNFIDTEIIVDETTKDIEDKEITSDNLNTLTIEIEEDIKNIRFLDEKSLKILNSKLSILNKYRQMKGLKRKTTHSSKQNLDDEKKSFFCDLESFSEDDIDFMSKNYLINKEIIENIEKNKDLFVNKPKSQEELFNRYIKNKLWRINNLYKIVDKHGKLIKFRMNRSQHKIFSRLLIHPRLLILKSRQQGISTLFLIHFIDTAIFTPNLTLSLINKGDTEGKRLVRRIKTIWDNIPMFIKINLGVSVPLVDNKSQLELPNKSIIDLGHNFRGDTCHGVHISEFGDISIDTPKRAVEIKEGTIQAISPERDVAIESTMKSTGNEFRNMWNIYKENIGKLTNIPKDDFLPVFLSFVDDLDCRSQIKEERTAEGEEYFLRLKSKFGVSLTEEQKNWWYSKRKFLGKGIYQEYPAVPEDALSVYEEGMYYKNLYEQSNYLTKDYSIDLNIPVQVSLDLGITDLGVLLFFQKTRDRYNFIHTYTNKKKNFSFYLNKMEDLAIENKFNLKRIIVPHDIAKAETEGGIPRINILNEWVHGNQRGRGYGREMNISKLERTTIVEGINLVQESFKNNRITINPKNNDYLIECVKNYSRNYDKTLKMFINTPPNRSKFNHGADALRYAVMGGINTENIPYYYEKNSSMNMYIEKQNQELYDTTDLEQQHISSKIEKSMNRDDLFSEKNKENFYSGVDF